MKQNNSKEVKRVIFEELSSTPRFTNILETVIRMFKQGQDPVVIESWNTFCQRHAPSDDMWEGMMKGEDVKAFRTYCKTHKPIKITSTAALNTKLLQPYTEASVTLTATGEHDAYKLVFTVPEKRMTDLIFWGYRDKNYFKLFFRQLGYKVSENQSAGKYGLLISLEE